MPESDQDLASLVPQLVLAIERDLDIADPEALAEELHQCIWMLKRRYLRQQLEDLGEQIARAESVQDTAKVESISAEFSRLTSELHQVEKKL